jgi:hypothetical protein
MPWSSQNALRLPVQMARAFKTAALCSGGYVFLRDSMGTGGLPVPALCSSIFASLAPKYGAELRRTQRPDMSEGIRHVKVAHHRPVSKIQFGAIKMNIPNDISRHSAILNALSSISKDRCFPKKVIVGHWEDYLFFDTFGTIFDPCFIDVKNLLLSEEKASVVALINLKNISLDDWAEPPAIFIEKDMEAKDYIFSLEQKEAPPGWRFLMDRYVCASDTGNWSIYCERQNNIAVFAFREDFPKLICSRVQLLLKAKSIKFSSPTGNDALFDFIDLLPDWRFTLVTEHTLM